MLLEESFKELMQEWSKEESRACKESWLEADSRGMTTDGLFSNPKRVSDKGFCRWSEPDRATSDVVFEVVAADLLHRDLNNEKALVRFCRVF